jgi:hypothetical protein
MQCWLVGTWLSTFQGGLLAPSSRVKLLKSLEEDSDCLSGKRHQTTNKPTSCNILEERIFQLHRDGSLNPRS